MPPLWDRPSFLDREIYQKVLFMDVDELGRVWMAVNGQLTASITLSAAISDRLSDRLSSGATASRINDLDQFYVDVQSPDLGGRFGDLLVEYSPNRQAPSRRLSGARLNYSPGNQQFRVAAGKLAGLTQAKEFIPQPLNQGPYALSEGRRTVLPNSEVVYLDGRRLERGSDRDYTIDYFNGEITFSPSLILTELQHVRVEFEESAHSYLRRAALADWRGLGYANKLSNHLSWQWEGDDPDAGIGFGLSPADRDTLTRIDDGSLVRQGAEYVGSGKGEYVLRETDESEFYEYVGPDEGDHNVRFE